MFSIGWWRLDGAAALFNSAEVLRDGVRTPKFAVADLMDERATTYDQRKPHPLIGEVLDVLMAEPWAKSAGIRMRGAKARAKSSM
ncbi:hypothetical protein OIU93_18205 [Paeniglutamicibacter sp. ZC-3]|uniref:hypothetical protein n=1 Tax=Paeniglutamicibacter sp. ZC-3 TaxID=2986919 RepID=UPI0021F7A7F5|nr:hypothetical protein [Paeniglutamicibacter sp. ZC-3]MCV9996210.1 hypothetical protein [Paeniglutamicibacter sp. ZC-3]